LPPATEPPPRQNGQAAGHNGRIHKRESSEPQPEDAIGAHTAEEYRRMNDRFVVAVQEAFRAGKESPAAACRVGGPSPAK
jgi:hypothetical protein